MIHQNQRGPRGHLTRKCREFNDKSPEERAQLVRDLGACKLCLTIHEERPCPFQARWQPCGVGGCEEFHSRLLHGAPALAVMHIFDSTRKTLLLMQEVSSIEHNIFVFWDNGSSISLVTKRYAVKHKLKGIPVSYDLLTVGNVVRPQKSWLYSVPIIDRNNNTTWISALEIEEICQDVSRINLKLAKLFNVEKRDIMRPRRNIEMLIGMGNAKAHPQLHEIKGDLVLYKSSYGSGKVLGGRHESHVTFNDTVNAYAEITAHSTYRNMKVIDLE